MYGIKRFCDIVLSALGLLVLSPLFLFVAIWVALDSKGPVFYKQLRVGRNNVDFYLYKFRSMHINAEKLGLITVGGRDARITRSGYYIRKFKIDELPQLINVLLGDMSLVGPRPEVRKYVSLYTEEQLHVLSVRPGITDAASIKYRNENDLLAEHPNPEAYYIQYIMPDKLQCNLEYIATWSLGRDLNLIFQTFFAIIFKK
ncbi:sugar transferase [Porphyromonas endodontalis]|uniref:sugar transferase n=1 Tax=Porphyromonas endodontalis TaxID=28124 RepID=UPI0036F32EAA